MSLFARSAHCLRIGRSCLLIARTAANGVSAFFLMAEIRVPAWAERSADAGP